MSRTLIAAAPEQVGKIVTVAGWVSVRRDHGKLIFLVLRDRSGSMQLVIAPQHAEALAAAAHIRAESSILVSGLVKERPGPSQEHALPTERVELEVQHLTVLAQPSGELPIDISKPELDLNLDTLLNHRTLTLRHPKVRALFKVYSELLRAYADTLHAAGFIEIKTPKILSAATEGGANYFKIKYFEREAFLAQSPQFYKQAAMSAFERVFEIGPVFRAEPHFTTRHVNEYTGLDAEMGFIESMEDVMAELERTVFALFRHLRSTVAPEVALFGANMPAEVAIPRMRLDEARAILKREYNKELEDGDIDSEGERLISEYVQRTTQSDFIFLTHYPTVARAFYTLPSPNNPLESESFDLIFRGVEIASGAQRIHDPQLLVQVLKARGLDPATFEDYIEVFRLGVPPHGGWGLGSERIIQKLLGLASIKEAVLYPRDVKRLRP